MIVGLGKGKVMSGSDYGMLLLSLMCIVATAIGPFPIITSWLGGMALGMVWMRVGMKWAEPHRT